MEMNELKLTITEVENGFMVSETITVKEERRDDEGTYFRYDEKIHVYHTVSDLVKYIEERLEDR